MAVREIKFDEILRSLLDREKTTVTQKKTRQGPRGERHDDLALRDRPHPAQLPGAGRQGDDYASSRCVTPTTRSV